MEITTNVIVLACGLVVLSTVALSWVIRARRKAKRPPRAVEAPNSHYQAPGVAALLDQERWESIRLERLHELNREEVRTILARLRSSGMRALSSSDRDFLDRMVRVAGTHRKVRGRTPDLTPRASGTA